MAAELHHHRRAVVALEVGQGLREGTGGGERVALLGGAVGVGMSASWLIFEESLMIGAALGVAVVPSSSLRGASDTGVVVQQVLSGSAVASTGMTAGDTITALDGKAVTSSDSLSSLMGTRYPGSTMKVTWTDTSGASHTAPVTLQKSTAN